MVLKMRSKLPIAIKICGITKTDQAQTISSLDIHAIGVIGVSSSPRYVIGDQRRKLFSKISRNSPEIRRVWVVADLSDEELDQALQGDGIPSVIQLHGNESCQRCSELRRRHPNTEFWKALRIRSQKDILIANKYAKEVNHLLLDAWNPNMLGGTGSQLPLAWLEEVDFPIPWWIAGGISAEWVKEGMKCISPFGIDASSKLETSPGVKDINKIHSLIKAVKKSKEDYSV